MLAEQAREQQKNANASRIFAQNSEDEDMIEDSRMETERLSIPQVMKEAIPR